ncbi:DUF2339 domain-containing protein [Acinetobacter sp. 194]|uniref:DUF2339 domain-containing protein n=1 Tax=Acinetobacter shaoyimingii TaxID=2715164 RepID=UPI00140B4B81|nr:DUF2339 domain-containing protein [Acinetobacter shaoyimingii]NHB59557.1 DUF2339 domain-containing protein [Acinetobacter shaoyimingii]
MFKGQNEIRMMWLMVLMIVGIGAWFLNVHALAYLCGIALIVSVIQYVDAIEKPTQSMSQQGQVKLTHTSRIPLYIASIVAVVGGFLHLSGMMALGITLWVFFFLRWLRRLENNLNTLQSKLKHSTQMPLDSHPDLQQTTNLSSQAVGHTTESSSNEIGLQQQIQQWLFTGNPVLKVAILILVIGVILLLRFATEHWQLSLAFKLTIVAGVSALVTILGYLLILKNRSFALALEGLGLAGLFLTLFFAYYNHVIPSLFGAGLCFIVIMAITLYLSLKQQAIELALMAMLIAYIAPFTLPVRDATAVELVTYYLVINIAVAILSTLRPWKILNQIAFLATTVIGGMYAIIHGYVHERNMMTILVIAHTAIFVWLSFRFSQLIAKSDIEQFKLKPALDIALIFSAPIVGYIFIYLMYFHQTTWQAGMSLGFAVVYAGLYQLAKKNQSVGLISQSYFSLMLIFLALIPPILLPDQWSVMGWAIEGALIYLIALFRASVISRYLAMGLLIVAGLSSLYYLVDSTEFPTMMFWALSLSYLTVVLGANAIRRFREQLSFISILFLSMLMLSACIMLIFLLLDYFSGATQFVHTLMIVAVVYFVLNECMIRSRATWSWLLPKWFALVPLLVFALCIVLESSQNGVIVWHSAFERIEFLLACLLMTGAWLRPMLGVRAEKEWVSLGTLFSLALASLALIPQMPFISVVILPLIFCAWSYKQTTSADWQIFWQTRSTLLLMMLWIICSQLFSQQAFQGYLLPILNPFDVVSLAVLAGFIWVLTLQMKHGLDKGIVAVLMVLSLLWLSSYIVLRALHVYWGTPYNDLALWDNAVVQLSLTLLWVSLAFVTMSLASRRKLRPMWILGGSILAVVTLKLVLFDLSHVGTIMRVLSFLGAGGIMLIIAYIAPMPESDQHLISKSNET